MRCERGIQGGRLTAVRQAGRSSAFPGSAPRQSISREGRTLGTVSAPVITYRRGYRFDVSPDQLWDRIEEVDQFEGWWPWLTDFRLDGDGLSAGSVLYGVVNPPLPYRMRLSVELVDCERPFAIDATIEGDLTGEAQLRFRPEPGGTWAEVAWTVEMRQPAMRLASRIGRPILQWGHDRVVEMTVAGFRRRIERP
jgi:uncharacterized protein YndB with AHSA1/START domain